jgi:Family of unknown function (DUF6502)
MKKKAMELPGRQRNFQFKLVFALLQYLSLMGVTEKELRVLSSRAFLALGRHASNRKSASNRSTAAAKVATAMQHWYLDQKLVDSAGKPTPLPLLGSAPSVEWLVRRAHIRSNAARFARELVTLKVLKRCRNGKFVPVGRHLIVRNSHPFLAEHHASSMIRLLRTARSNVSAKSPSDLIFERCADIQHLPRRKTRAFREFTNQQCEVFIDTINDWLESNNAVGKASSRTQVREAGVHVFAFLGSGR